MEITNIKDILTDFKAIFFDSYGVLKNHRGLIPGVQYTLDYLKEVEIPFRILTNDASRSQKAQADKFSDLGIKGIAAADIVTSGMMASQYLKHKVESGLIAYIGTSEAAKAILDERISAIPISELDFEKAKDIVAIVFLDDEGYDWRNTINHTINLLRRVNVPVIIANTDQIYPVAQNDVSLATGGIAQLAENVVRRKFIKFGKPDSQMFNYAFNDLNQKGYNLQRSDVLMVGDTLHTDILGGNKFGAKTALVLTGNTTERNAQMLIQSTGVIPDYICKSILLDA